MLIIIWFTRRHSACCPLNLCSLLTTPSSLNESISASLTLGCNSADFLPSVRKQECPVTLIRQRQRVNGSANQILIWLAILAIGSADFWHSRRELFLSSLCSQASSSRIVLSRRRLYLPFFSFLRRNVRISSTVSSRGESPHEWQVLATCSSTWSPSFNFNKTVLAPRSGMLVWSKCKRHERDGGRRSGGMFIIIYTGCRRAVLLILRSILWQVEKCFNTGMIFVSIRTKACR